MDSRVARRIGMKVPILAMLFIVCLIALAAGVLWWPRIAEADVSINNFFAPYRVRPFLAGFMWLTAVGANPTVVAVCVTMTGLLWVARLSGLILPLWIAFAGGEATSWSLKYLVGRTRPPFLEVASATSPSFPSGHSMSSMVVYGFAAFVLTSRGPRRRTGVAAAVALALLILLIGFSRVFLSLHFASDVLGGFLVGGFWLLMGIMRAARNRG
jgi:membrane-associated phospholipid phosphatase